MTRQDIKILLHTESSQRRCAQLTKINEIPLPLVEDLLCLDLETHEKHLLIERAGCSNNIDFEHFLTNCILNTDQNLGAHLVDIWAQKSEHILWFRMPLIVKSRHAPQRIKFRILAQCSKMAANMVLDAILNCDGVEEFSPLFSALLLRRCLEWNHFHPKAQAMALETLRACIDRNMTEPIHGTPLQAAPSAITWLLAHDRKSLIEIIDSVDESSHLNDLFALARPYLSNQSKIDSSEILSIQHIHDDELSLYFQTKWPDIWDRKYLASNQICVAYRRILKCKQTSQYMKYFLGCDHQEVLSTLLSMDKEREFVRAIHDFLGFVLTTFHADIFAKIKTFMTSSDQPEQFIADLPGFIRLTLQSNPEATFAAIEDYIYETTLNDSGHFPEHKQIIDAQACPSSSKDGEDDLTNQDRRRFFDIAYRQYKVEKATSKISEKENDRFWPALSHSWVNPNPIDLRILAGLARQAPALFRPCYINTLGRFKGSDEAALKLLDFIHSRETLELHAIVDALRGIGTPRAMQELISLLTRTAIPVDVAVKACEALHSQDLSDLQSELRATISDLRERSLEDERYQGIRENLGELIIANSSAKAELKSSERDINLDKLLASRIGQYSKLSSDVKRALRTAEFFGKEIAQHKNAAMIDLSPLVDMQYKALELLFRENFEDSCFKLVAHGILQRKLDIIGYARPVPQAMGIFEDYLNRLNSIRDVAHFSKFKLRKMLRAISTYRPGKRFTLDGLKAFSLFFLCFARKDCPYGLTNIIDLPFVDDNMLFKFCADLHIFQDFRNRAAHEGFRPETRRDIDKIWQSTAEIIEIVYKIAGPLAENADHFTESEPVNGRLGRAS